jgi:hypothetical protein
VLIETSPLTTVFAILCLSSAHSGSQQSLHGSEKWGSSWLASYWQQTFTTLALQLPYERATMLMHSSA